ncbi:MAG: nucleotidyltransferase family protein [Alphaproteobacteria bacterium]|nr:nucleotidyltransferase family protein [Alphaproteobacteria bacterium]
MSGAGIAGEDLPTALILAGSRGPDDPVAALGGVSHKAMVPVLGRPMLLRVVETLAGSGLVGRIIVQIERPELPASLPELAALQAGGRLAVEMAAASPSRSLLKAFRDHPEVPSWIVTTADHPLLDAAMLRHFWQALPPGTEAAAALASAQTIGRAYPGTRRTYLKFRDRRVSGCNLFAFRGPNVARVPDFWIALERHRKRPWRMAWEIGPLVTLAFLCRLLSQAQVFRILSRRIGVRAVAIDMPFAEAAIDVDKAEDLALVEKILARREGAMATG